MVNILLKSGLFNVFPEEDHSMGEPRYSLTYNEFIPLNTRMIQLLTKRIEALESKLT